MTGLHPLTNCRCLALVDFSATRKTTKLAGTKDMATMIKMAMTTSVPCSLKEDPAQFQEVVGSTMVLSLPSSVGLTYR